MARKRITYWDRASDQGLDFISGLVREFNSLQDEFIVESGESSEHRSEPSLMNMLAMIEQGAAPDLITLDDKYFTGLAAANALLPLNELADRTLAQSSIDLRYLNLGQDGATVFGIPISIETVMLYINISALRELNLDENSQPTFIEAFDCYLDELARLGKLGLIPSYSGWWPQIWPWLFGGGWCFRNGVFSPDSPENIEAYKWVVSLRDRITGNRFRDAVNPVDSGPDDPFFAGEAVMVLEGSWFASRLAMHPDISWRPAALPSISGEGVMFVESDLVAIPRGAANPEGAARFLEFICAPANLERLAVSQGRICPVGKPSGSYFGDHPNPLITEIHNALQSARLHCNPRVSGWSEYFNRIREAFSAIWEEGEPPPQALRAIRDAYSGR